MKVFLIKIIKSGLFLNHMLEYMIIIKMFHNLNNSLIKSYYLKFLIIILYQNNIVFF